MKTVSKHLRLILLVIGLTVVLVACRTAVPSIVLTIAGKQLQTELAVTPAEREKGLMFRKSMPEDHGMLFIFPYDQTLSFWMKNTLIPLSVAYLSVDGEIKEIHDMSPQSLEAIQSNHSVRFALEVNQGLFSKWGASVGDRVALPPDLPTPNE